MNISKIFILLILVTLAGCKPTYHFLPPGTPVSYVGRANAAQVLSYLRQGYTDKADEKLQLALYQAPNDPIVLDVAGYFYEKTGQIAQADKYFKQAIVVAPYSGSTNNNYGAFLCRNGSYAASIPYFVTAEKVGSPKIAGEARKSAGYCYQQLKTRLGGSAT